MVRVKPVEIKEVMVEEKIDMLAVLFISMLLVFLVIVLFTVICIKLSKETQTKGLKADLNDIKCVNEDELKQSFVQDVSSTNDNLKEVFVPDNCHNKSISSEASTKCPDTSTDNSSRSDQSDADLDTV